MLIYITERNQPVRLCTSGNGEMTISKQGLPTVTTSSGEILLGDNLGFSVDPDDEITVKRPRSENF